MKLGALIDALELLVEEKKINTRADTTSDELQNIVAEILDTIYQSSQINELEKKIRHAMSIDIATLEKAVDLIKKAKPKQTNPNKKYNILIKLKKILEDLSKFIDLYKNNNTNKKNTIAKVEIFYDPMFDKILSTFESGNTVFVQLKELLIKKLDVLDEKTALLLWANIKACFGVDEKTAAYKIYDSIFPENFFTTRNKMNVREKCAEVLVKYKPLTYRMMFEEGENSFPLILPGVPKILTLTDPSDISRITCIELLLVRSLSQIVATYVSVVDAGVSSSSDNRESLAKMINTNSSGFIFDGDFYYEYKNTIDEVKEIDQKRQMLLLNVKRAIKYTSALSESQAKIESVLRQYKMGQEIIWPARENEFKAQKQSLEVYLQKDMCKFFLERRIPAFGKSLGRGIIDLYHKDIAGEDFVIEAKVYDRKNTITGKKLNVNVVQLQSYMDQHEQPRGILAIYNLSDTLVIAPRKWLKGQILIICINLCNATPSKRKSSLEIIESENGIIDMINVND